MERTKTKKRPQTITQRLQHLPQRLAEISRNQSQENLTSEKEKFFDLTQDQNKSPVNDSYARLLELSHKSKTLSMMLDEVLETGWKTNFAADIEGPYALDIDRKIITLNNHGLTDQGLESSQYFFNSVFLAFATAIRDIWQEKRHPLILSQYKPENILMLERVRMADLDIVTLLICWEVRSAGNQGLWRHYLASENGDLAIAFTKKLEADFSENAVKSAMRFAFQHWYDDVERVNACDHAVLEYIDRMSAPDETGLRLQVFGDKDLAPVRIEILSCLPDKTAYLRGLGNDILCNPHYSGFYDEINQTHLYHIMRDMNVIFAGGVPFRSTGLAAKIFPSDFSGDFSSDFSGEE